MWLAQRPLHRTLLFSHIANLAGMMILTKSLIDRNSPCKTSENTSRIPCTQHLVNRASSHLLPIRWQVGGDGCICTISGGLVWSCRSDIHVWTPYLICIFHVVLWTCWTRISVVLGYPDCLWEMPSGCFPYTPSSRLCSAGISRVDKRWSSMSRSWSWTLFTQMGVAEVCTSYTRGPLAVCSNMTLSPVCIILVYYTVSWCKIRCIRTRSWSTPLAENRWCRMRV